MTARLTLALPIAVMLAAISAPASATPDAATAKRCLRAAYMLYPYKRPGAVPMSGDRLFYFRQCMAGQGGTAAESVDRK